MRRTYVAILAAVAIAVMAVAAVCLATGGGGSDYTAPGNDGGSGGTDERFDYRLTPVTGDMLEWRTPDEAEADLDAAIEAYLETSGTEGSDMLTAYTDLVRTVNGLTEEYAAFYWDYCRDPVGNSAHYTGWSTLEGSMATLFEDAVRESLYGPNADDVRAIIGDEEAERILAGSSMTDELRELLTRESELENLYLTGEGDAAEVYLELVRVRNGIAAYYGYEDYMDYAYAEVYGRDYAPDDVDAVEDLVIGFVEAYFYAVQHLDGDLSDYTYSTQEELFADIGPFIDAVDADISAVYDYLLEYGLIDFEDLDGKVSSTFTMRAGDLVYIFSDPSMDYRDVASLVHELGHACRFLLNPYGSMDYDTAEIHSQGMEALLALIPGTVFGDLGDAYTAYFLEDVLSSVLTGFIVNEFEQMVYSGAAETAEDLDALFQQAAIRFGVLLSTPWSSITHLFIQPGYYISYAVSAFNALEIFIDGLDSWDTAVDEYLDLLAYGGSGYIGTTGDLGMLCIFDREDVSYLLSELYGYLGSVV